LIAAIKDLRKGGTVSSQTQETQFNALNKYAKNLIELARQGKLDPVIGRDEEIREHCILSSAGVPRTIQYWLENRVWVKLPLQKGLLCGL
jgi:hypothetical protein